MTYQLDISPMSASLLMGFIHEWINHLKTEGNNGQLLTDVHDQLKQQIRQQSSGARFKCDEQEDNVT